MTTCISIFRCCFGQLVLPTPETMYQDRPPDVHRKPPVDTSTKSYTVVTGPSSFRPDPTSPEYVRRPLDFAVHGEPTVLPTTMVWTLHNGRRTQPDHVRVRFINIDTVIPAPPTTKHNLFQSNVY